MTEKEIKLIRVVCVSGKFDNKSYFVLEPTCSETCMCGICKNGFWIEQSNKVGKELKQCH